MKRQCPLQIRVHPKPDGPQYHHASYNREINLFPAPILTIAAPLRQPSPLSLQKPFQLIRRFRQLLLGFLFVSLQQNHHPTDKNQKRQGHSQKSDPYLIQLHSVYFLVFQNVPVRLAPLLKLLTHLQHDPTVFIPVIGFKILVALLKAPVEAHRLALLQSPQDLLDIRLLQSLQRPFHGNGRHVIIIPHFRHHMQIPHKTAEIPIVPI